jgi:thiol-disulfide isomerase/thioredoxin
MKKIFFAVFGLILSAMMLISSSCDKVDPPYMTVPDEVKGDTVRKMLLEDFTGHHCVNCPAAHKIIEDLHKVYGERMVVMVIHTGFFAKPSVAPFDYDFRTQAGDDIGTQFGAISSTLPKGMANRKDNGSGYLINPTAYGTAVSLILDSMPEKPDIYIELSPSYNTTDSSISVDVKMTALTDMPSGKYNLSVMVTESNIIKAQKNNDPTIGPPEILDYHHNDVLRAGINGSWGDEIINGKITNGQVFNKSYANFKIGSDWNPDELKIVAFVYYADGPNDKVVIQAESVKLR